MIFKHVLPYFTFLVLIFFGCSKEKDQQLIKIVDSFQIIFNDDEMKNIKQLHKDSLYNSNYETYKKYLLLFDENNEKLESTVYFKSKKIEMAVGFKFDLLVIALNFKLNNKNELINFPFLRANVLHRSKHLNRARFEKSN